jgi:hypothetical protein
MSIFRNCIISCFLLITTNPAFAQAISTDFQKNCVREQVAEHRGTKGKELTEDDFSVYCTCQAEYISKNARNSQINEVLMNPKAKPEWLKALEPKAMKSCLSADSKIRT